MTTTIKVPYGTIFPSTGYEIGTDRPLVEGVSRVETFHLQGQHDQQSHAGDRAGSKLPAGVGLDDLDGEFTEASAAEIVERFNLWDGDNEWETTSGARLYRSEDDRYVTIEADGDGGTYVDIKNDLYEVDVDTTQAETDIENSWREDAARSIVYHGTRDGETAESLAPRLAAEGADLMIKTLDGLEQGKVTPRPQPSDGANTTPMLRRNFGKVDWSMPARQLVNRLRGFTPWPGLYTSFRGGRLKIFGLEEVKPAPRGDEKPGTVITVEPAGIMVRCGRGTAARLTELQREGRRRMPVDAFQIGERVVRGESLG